MTITNVYVGKLLEGPDPLGHVAAADGQPIPPPRLGDFFPPARHDPFYALLGYIRDGKLTGQQVDWGASAAIVSRQDILDFIEEIYRDDPTYTDPTRSPHLFPKLAGLRSFVDALPDVRYALVAIEL